MLFCQSISPACWNLPRKFTSAKAYNDDLNLQHYATPMTDEILIKYQISNLSNELVQKNANTALNLKSKLEQLMKKNCFIILKKHWNIIELIKIYSIRYYGEITDTSFFEPSKNKQTGTQ